mgnify:CR=1 FL=1|jgi:phenylacetate-coenzyme A ligase PaaK-like adenylate-forming protein
MMYLENLLKQKAYSLDPNEKKNLFKKEMNFLTNFHYKKSKLYKKFLKGVNYNLKISKPLKMLPYIPVRLFKNFDLLSIDKKQIFKTLSSSGTSSNNLSKIYLDKKNAFNQIKVLQNIFHNLFGNSRVPMLILNKENLANNRNTFNASTAAINGFSMFASEKIYLLNQNNEINYDLLKKFLNKNNNKKFIVFGFTSDVYLNLIKKINPKNINKKSFSKAILIHGGGWKKIEKLKIGREKFYKLIKNKIGINSIKNYYGLIEQIGSIFFECNCGYFIASNFSDIIIRDADFNVCGEGKKGLIQLFSLLPTSYPGHSILTEDIGEIVNDSKCNCYGHGTRFRVHGRLKEAELRGCSNI